MNECDIQRDRAWTGQWYCAMHCLWFRGDGEPGLCPAGEAWLSGIEDAARVADAEHDSCESLARAAGSTAAKTLMEERALVAARIADDIRALTPANGGDGVCTKREDGTHCEHWWDGDEPCCGCGDGAGGGR